MPDKEKACCVCGSPDVAPGILRYTQPVVLAAFPNLRPRKRFPLCSTCRRKIRWVEIDKALPPPEVQ